MKHLQAVVLAAGDGGRLRPRTFATPKPLLVAGGRRIINHVLDALFAAGVRETSVVVGYRGDQIREALANVSPCGMTLRFVENEHYLLGNARSLWAARECVAGGFVLVMADHLFDPALLHALIAGAGSRYRLAVERAAPGDPRGGEATRARIEAGRVVDLGKHIDNWNAFDTGAFWCVPAVFDAITPDLRDGEAGAVFAALARAGLLDAVDVTGSRWADIDTEDDFRVAEAMLAGSAAARG